MGDPIAADQLALCTLAQVKKRARITTIESDDLIKSLIAVALARLNSSAQREFLPWVTETRPFKAERDLVELDYSDLRPNSDDSPVTVVLHPELGANASTLVEGTDYELAVERQTGTAGRLRLARHVSLCSLHAYRFGHAQLTVAGGWGIWEQLCAVPVDINEAAIECVLSWVDKAVENAAQYSVGSAGTGLPNMVGSWDIPTAAWRKVQPYSRAAGVG